MPHGAPLTEAEQLEVTAAETGQLPPEGFSSDVVRAHFLAQRGVVVTPIGFLRGQETTSLESVRQTEEELPFIIAEEGLPGGAEAFRPGGAFFDIGPRAAGLFGFDGEPQDAIFDKWTPVHVAFGLTLAILKVPRPLAYAAIAGLEVAEIALRRAGVFPGFFTETPENVLGDLVTGVAGFEIGRFIPTR